mmetsp:Transcript_21934/g.49036  ORF Transcript_21934/g.49036 Transcript_21934/m.49036 type:complete len:530 (+) Transcript_21934:191-1780(+)
MEQPPPAEFPPSVSRRRRAVARGSLQRVAALQRGPRHGRQFRWRLVYTPGCLGAAEAAGGGRAGRGGPNSALDQHQRAHHRRRLAGHRGRVERQGRDADGIPPRRSGGEEHGEELHHRGVRGLRAAHALPGAPRPGDHKLRVLALHQGRAAARDPLERHGPPQSEERGGGRHRRWPGHHGAPLGVQDARELRAHLRRGCLVPPRQRDDGRRHGQQDEGDRAPDLPAGADGRLRPAHGAVARLLRLHLEDHVSELLDAAEERAGRRQGGILGERKGRQEPGAQPRQHGLRLRVLLRGAERKREVVQGPGPPHPGVSHRQPVRGERLHAGGDLHAHRQGHGRPLAEVVEPDVPHGVRRHSAGRHAGVPRAQRVGRGEGVRVQAAVAPPAAPPHQARGHRVPEGGVQRGHLQGLRARTHASPAAAWLRRGHARAVLPALGRPGKSQRVHDGDPDAGVGQRLRALGRRQAEPGAHAGGSRALEVRPEEVPPETEPPTPRAPQPDAPVALVRPRRHAHLLALALEHPRRPPRGV